mgnify:CR=1 FL=1
MVHVDAAEGWILAQSTHRRLAADGAELREGETSCLKSESLQRKRNIIHHHAMQYLLEQLESLRLSGNFD